MTAPENEPKTEPVKETVVEPEKVNPTPEHTLPPVDPPHADSDLRDLVKDLADKVEGLETLVRELAPTEKDTTPSKPPWTHKGSWK